MKASYKLQLEQHQRRLGLTHKELNRETRKHNAINLLKKLQSLEPKVSAPASAPEPARNTGWYGNIFLELLSLRANGIETSYSYTIYKGSTDQTPVLASNSLTNDNYNFVIGSTAHILDIADRLENDSSTFLVTIDSFSGGNLSFVSIKNGILVNNPDRVQPSVIGTDVRIRFSIEAE